ncbi:MAG: FAD-dependent oxidoreductase, partial [Chloroflexota bacterium]|nr:FAD-dependent oxidoreductase [Chloroflexota bacterium]
AIRRRFPAWNSEVYVDGYYTAKAGYVESGNVISRLAGLARSHGIDIRTGEPVAAVATRAGAGGRVRLESGAAMVADVVVVATGAWTPLLLPELAAVMRPVGQPVFHLLPADPARFSPPQFVVFGADSSRTGWYGFPAHPETGIVKIANHGPGHPVHPRDDPRAVSPDNEARLRRFLAETFPGLAGAPLVDSRRCLYCDTPDEHFWIGRHPTNPALCVAAGDSGHAFKFAPILGRLIADAATGRPSSLSHRFGWRAFAPGATGQEASRARAGERDNGGSANDGLW